MRVLFCGGGTAGHVNPSIAIAQTIMRNYPESKIAYVATLNGIENSLVNFKKYQIDVMGIRKAISFKNFMVIGKMLKAIKECEKIIDEFRPDLVFGTGGYATYPVIVASKKKGIKSVLHESNVMPGKAILALENKVEKIFVNFDETKKYFKNKDKIVRTGNPIRRITQSENKQELKKQLDIRTEHVILCTSGSLGATRVNEAVIELIDNYVRYRDDITLIWSTGTKDYEASINKLKVRNLLNVKNVIVSNYLENILDYIFVADIVVSRAGAMSISELATMKKSSILIPSPNVTNNHQFLNAQTLEKSNAAIMITEDKLYNFVDAVRDLLNDSFLMKELSKNISAFSIENSNKKILYEIQQLL